MEDRLRRQPKARRVHCWTETCSNWVLLVGRSVLRRSKLKLPGAGVSSGKHDIAGIGIGFALSALIGRGLGQVTGRTSFCARRNTRMRRSFRHLQLPVAGTMHDQLEHNSSVAAE